MDLTVRRPSSRASLLPTCSQVFETTIRILGGLLSAFYHTGGDEMYLRKALEFGERCVRVCLSACVCVCMCVCPPGLR